MGFLLLSVLLGAPTVGDLAPHFVVTDTDGRVQTLSHMLRQGPVVVAFFPRAFSPD